MVRQHSLRPDVEPAPVDRLLPLLNRSRVVRGAVLALAQESRLRTELILRDLVWAYGRFNDHGELPASLFDRSLNVEQATAIIDTAGSFRGLDGFNAMLAELRQAFGDIRFEPSP